MLFCMLLLIFVVVITPHCFWGFNTKTNFLFLYANHIPSSLLCFAATFNRSFLFLFFHFRFRWKGVWRWHFITSPSETKKMGKATDQVKYEINNSAGQIHCHHFCKLVLFLKKAVSLKILWNLALVILLESSKPIFPREKYHIIYYIFLFLVKWNLCWLNSWTSNKSREHWQEAFNGITLLGFL